jgi:hypothetical protein
MALNFRMVTTWHNMPLFLRQYSCRVKSNTMALPNLSLAFGLMAIADKSLELCEIWYRG